MQVVCAHCCVNFVYGFRLGFLMFTSEHIFLFQGEVPFKAIYVFWFIWVWSTIVVSTNMVVPNNHHSKIK